MINRKHRPLGSSDRATSSFLFRVTQSDMLVWVGTKSLDVPLDKQKPAVTEMLLYSMLLYYIKVRKSSFLTGMFLWCVT